MKNSFYLLSHGEYLTIISQFKEGVRQKDYSFFQNAALELHSLLKDAYKSLLNNHDFCSNYQLNINLAYSLAESCIVNIAKLNFSFDEENMHYDDLLIFMEYYLKHATSVSSLKDWFLVGGSYGLSQEFVEYVIKTKLILDTVWFELHRDKIFPSYQNLIEDFFIIVDIDDTLKENITKYASGYFDKICATTIQKFDSKNKIMLFFSF